MPLTPWIFELIHAPPKQTTKGWSFPEMRLLVNMQLF